MLSLLKVIISTSDEELVSICERYWDINKKMRYTYHVRDIAFRFDISLLKVTEIASNNSALVSKGKDCAAQLNIYKKRKDFHPDELLSSEFFLCKTCLEEYKSQQVLKTQVQKPIFKKTPINKEQKYKRMNLALETDVWKELDEAHIETLIIIAESQNKSEVLSKVFYDNREINSDFRQKIWSRMNNLEKMNLIWIENDDQFKIKEFHILDDLRKVLRLKYPYLFLT